MLFPFGSQQKFASRSSYIMWNHLLYLVIVFSWPWTCNFVGPKELLIINRSLIDSKLVFFHEFSNYWRSLYFCLAFNSNRKLAQVKLWFTNGQDVRKIAWEKFHIFFLWKLSRSSSKPVFDRFGDFWKGLEKIPNVSLNLQQWIWNSYYEYLQASALE